MKIDILKYIESGEWINLVRGSYAGMKVMSKMKYRMQLISFNKTDIDVNSCNMGNIDESSGEAVFVLIANFMNCTLFEDGLGSVFVNGDPKKIMYLSGGSNRNFEELSDSVARRKISKYYDIEDKQVFEPNEINKTFYPFILPVKGKYSLCMRNGSFVDDDKFINILPYPPDHPYALERLSEIMDFDGFVSKQNLMIEQAQNLIKGP